MTEITVLIVDDEASIRDMIAMTLELNGYRCLHACNALDAHAIVQEQQPDLILLDWMMPGVTGIELARRLRRDEVTCDIPIIMLTAKVEEGEKVNGLGLAIVKHLLINHDGNLKIESQMEAGSAFTCEFPSQRLQMPESAPASI